MIDATFVVRALNRVHVSAVAEFAAEAEIVVGAENVDAVSIGVDLLIAARTALAMTKQRHPNQWSNLQLGNLPNQCRWQRNCAR